MARIYKGQSHEFEEVALLSDAGGMANVYLAAEVGRPEHKVAVKVPKTGLPQDVTDLFLREAEAAKRVISPYVVTLIDWGDAPPFIAYEYMAGGTLGREIQRREQASDPWPQAELTALYRMLVDGMLAINEQVIHRDLKPDNIYLDAGRLRISDFGISKYVSETTRTLTFKGAGTDAYMAPETFRVNSTDWKADQYSLGVVFYELATLERPFTGDWDALEQAHLYRAAPRITGKRSDLPLRLASLVGRMLEKEPNRRFGSWQAILDELSSIDGDASNAEAGSTESGELAKRAAAALHAAKTKQLAAEEATDQRKAWEDERDRLVAYWAEQFFAKIRDRVDALNDHLGEEGYKLATPKTQAVGGTHWPTRCSVKFFHGELIIELAPAPYQNERQALGWGIVALRTNARGWFSNLVLLSDPQPYGTWQQIDMEISGIMRPGSTPENRLGGKYEIIGNSRIVLGLDWKFLQGEWDYRTTMSVVNYSETQLDYDALVDQLFDVLTDDGPAEKPASAPTRGPLGGLRFPDV